MMTMCPSCFELYSEIWLKPCCGCGYKTINVSVELIGVVKLLLNRGFTVAYANCATHKDQAGSGKNTQITIELRKSYPESIFSELPPGWLISEFNLVKDNNVLQPPLTMLSCICRHPPSECDMESIMFEKRLTISNFEVWLEDKDPDAFKALLILTGYL